MISQKTIDKIFSTIRVEEIVGEYVQLKRAGSNFKGLSPFQDEKTPSFVVSPSKQIWKDFSSGKGGNAIAFLMEVEGFTYPEALKYAAKKYGIEVEEDQVEMTDEQKKAKTEKEQLFKIHEVASQFFQDQMSNTEEGRAIGLSYFKERNINTESIETFKLGYSPVEKNAFTKYALDKGYSKELLEKSGLSIFPEYNPEGVDRFRERIIFPIETFSGRVVGFGARILKSNVKAAKYLNSPETEIYHKSKVLYGLNNSKQSISRKDEALLVEGYMDVISLHQNGITNVVASSGTALTTDQIRLIKRLTQNVTILFDGDAAGIKASFRSIDLLLEQDMNVRVLLFPEGDDPDSFAQKHSQEDVENFIKNNAKDFIAFKADILLKEAGEDPIKKGEAIRDIVKSVSKVQNVLQKEVFLKQIGDTFGISHNSLFNELEVQHQLLKKGTGPKKQTPVQANPSPMQVVQEIPIETSALLFLEEKLIELMLKYGDVVLHRKDDDGEEYDISVIEEIIDHFEEDEYPFQSSINKKIMEDMKEGLDQEEIRSGNFFLNLMDQEISTKVTDTMIDQYELSDWNKHNIFFSTEIEVLPKVVSDVIIRHKREFAVQMIENIKSKLSEDGDNTEYYQQIMRLAQLKKKIDEMLYRII